MAKSLEKINLAHKDLARELLNECLFEWAILDSSSTRFDVNGVPIYQFFDAYWTDKKRFPFFLLLDMIVVGFVFVREIENGHSIAEFYVKPQFRGAGISLEFANLVADQFGHISFDTLKTNARAVKFWNKFYAQFDCKKKTWEDEKRIYWTVEKGS